jgi:rare lipoprotein A (peptidoglycan hydrolase)
MKAGRDRRGRKDDSWLRRETSTRRGRRVRWACLAAAIFSLAGGATPVQALTGGVAATSSSEEAVPAEQGIAFTQMRAAGATWYGPGLYGNHTACGETLTPATIGVAHKTLPCGTKVKLAYHGHLLITTVIDRGPYSAGNSFDLTNGARRALGFSGADRLQYAVAVQYARHGDS